MNAMRNASDVTLNTIPKLKKTSLRFAFVSVSELKMDNASMLENNDELSELKRRTEELIKKREEKKRKEEEEEVREILKEGMMHAADLSVPLEIDMHSGKNWYEAK